MTDQLRLPRTLWLVIVAGMLFGMFGVGLNVEQAITSSAKDRSDQATANRSTCQSKANAQWRDAISKVIVGGVEAPRHPRDIQLVLAGLRRLDELKDDAKLIDDPKHPLCPYVPGHPELTPTEPQRAP